MFKNTSNQWRAGWEILLVVATIFIMTMIVSFTLSLRIDSVPLFKSGEWVRIFKSNGLYILITVCFTVRVVHRRPLSSIGLARIDARQLFTGFLSGAFLLTAVVLFLWGLNHVFFQGEWLKPRFQYIDVISLVITAFMAGICEEILFRGYIQHLLSNRLSVPWAIFITSVTFSLAHMANPEYTWISAINIGFIACILSFMTLRTGNLYFAIGFHMAWNLFQGYVFGISVSGEMSQGIYPVILSGGSMLTGGGFGLEGSLLATLILGLVCVVILNLPASTFRRTSRFERPWS